MLPTHFLRDRPNISRSHPTWIQDRATLTNLVAVAVSLRLEVFRRKISNEEATGFLYSFDDITDSDAWNAPLLDLLARIARGCVRLCRRESSNSWQVAEQWSGLKLVELVGIEASLVNVDVCSTLF